MANIVQLQNAYKDGKGSLNRFERAVLQLYLFDPDDLPRADFPDGARESGIAREVAQKLSTNKTTDLKGDVLVSALQRAIRSGKQKLVRVVTQEEAGRSVAVRAETYSYWSGLD